MIERACVRCQKNNPDFDKIVDGSPSIPWDWGLTFGSDFKIILPLLSPLLMTEPTGIVCPECQTPAEQKETLDIAMVDAEIEMGKYK